ncbi:MAG TPA: acetolactate synthase [Opitutaceae bacterium]|nr:acetolactate synthase [Opitutaceae bacterium]
MTAPTSSSLSSDPVKQFSVYTENRVGRLFDLTTLFATHNVHIMAITTLDTTDSAIVRLIVDDPDKARELMVNNDFPYTECDIIAVEITDESELKSVLSVLFEVEINIHYVYSFIKRPGGKSGLALNIEDADIAAQALAKRGIKVLSQSDISR